MVCEWKVRDENLPPVVRRWNVILSASRDVGDRVATSVMIDIDSKGRCKSDYYTMTTMTWLFSCVHECDYLFPWGTQWPIILLLS